MYVHFGRWGYVPLKAGIKCPNDRQLTLPVRSSMECGYHLTHYSSTFRFQTQCTSRCYKHYTYHALQTGSRVISCGCDLFGNNLSKLPSHLKKFEPETFQIQDRHSMLCATCLAGALQYHGGLIHTQFRNADTASGIFFKSRLTSKGRVVYSRKSGHEPPIPLI